MNNTLFIIAQILGVLSFISAIISSAKTSTDKVLFYNGLGNTIASVQYLLLGGYTGALCCIIAAVRNIVFAKFKDKVPLHVLVFYLIVVVLINFPLVHSIIDVLPIFNIMIYAIALWTKKILTIKVGALSTFVTGILYDFSNKAYTSMLTQVIDGVVGTVSLIIVLKEKKKKGEH